jgi:transposase
MFVWLPPYCSDLNPIERFWRHLKDLACANKLQDNIEAVVKSAEKILSEQNRSTSDLRFLLSKNL